MSKTSQASLRRLVMSKDSQAVLWRLTARAAIAPVRNLFHVDPFVV